MKYIDSERRENSKGCDSNFEEKCLNFKQSLHI